MNRFTPLCLVLLWLGGCAAQMSRPAPSAEANAPAIAPDDSLYATLWQQASLEHDLVYAEVYRDAQSKLPRALRDPRWDALPHPERAAVRHGSLRGLKPAIILDIDETVLDNSPQQARQIKRGAQAFDPAAFDAWVAEAAAQPLPGALALTKFAAAHGIRVFYISNRDQDMAGATLANLRKAGFPVFGDGAFLGLGMKVEGCTPQHGSKGCRRELVARKYRVLMEFGDQIGDFLDLAANTPDGRREAMEPYRDWIGERWFVLPNPVYGSWLNALDDGAKTPDAKRAAEHAALATQ